MYTYPNRPQGRDGVCVTRTAEASGGAPFSSLSASSPLLSLYLYTYASGSDESISVPGPGWAWAALHERSTQAFHCAGLVFALRTCQPARGGVLASVPLALTQPRGMPSSLRLPSSDITRAGEQVITQTQIVDALHRLVEDEGVGSEEHVWSLRQVERYLYRELGAVRGKTYAPEWLREEYAEMNKLPNKSVIVLEYSSTP